MFLKRLQIMGLYVGYILISRTVIVNGTLKNRLFVTSVAVGLMGCFTAAILLGSVKV